MLVDTSKFEVVLKICEDLIIQSKTDNRAYLYVENNKDMNLYCFTDKMKLYDLYRKCVEEDVSSFNFLERYKQFYYEVENFIIDASILNMKNRKGVL